MHTTTAPPALPPFGAVSTRGRIRGALAALSLAGLLASLATSSANVALPTLARAFGASFQAVQWVVIAYLLAITTSVVAFGRLGDLVGARRLLVAGLLVFAVASAAGSVAPSLGLLIGARLLQGLGAAILLALTVAFVGQIVPKDRTGSAMGLLGTTSAIGTALGPSVGGALIGLWNWRAIFLVNVPLALTCVALLVRYLPRDPMAPRRVGFDHQGTWLLGATLAAYALALTLGRGDFGWLNAALLGVALMGLVAFLKTERTADAPLIRLALLGDAATGASLLANLVVSAVLMATLIVGPFYLSIALGLEPGAVGLVMSLGPVVSALVGVPAGRLVDRSGTRRTSLIGLSGVAFGSLVLALLPEAAGIPGYAGPIALMTASYALFQAANNTRVMQAVAAGERGVVAGTLNLSRNLGLVTGACLLGAVFVAATQASDVTRVPAAVVASAARLTFAVAAGLTCAAFVGMARASSTRSAAAHTLDKHLGRGAV